MPDRFLTIDQVTAEAMTILPGATSEDRIYAKQWAYTALREIGPSRNNIRVVDLFPDDNLTFRKPDDCQSVIDIAVFNSNNNELRSKYRSGNKRIHQPRNVFVNLGIFVEEFNSIVEISEDAHFMYMSSTATSGHASYAKLRYFSFPVDDEGNPMFPEYTRLAIVLFIRWMWSMRTGEINSNQAKEDWKEQRNIAKSKQRLNQLEFKQIAKEFNSMIQKVNFDRF